MKNLANCKPSEFLCQTNKIRKYAANWLEITGISQIRKNVPEFDVNDTKEQRQAKLNAQAKKNVMEILDAIMEKHPDESLGLLALLCFVEPENVDDYPVSFYLESFNELINDKVVMNFFTSLMSLVHSDTLTA